MDLGLYLEVFVPIILVGVATGILFFKIKESYLVASLAAGIVMLIMFNTAQYQYRLQIPTTGSEGIGFILLGLAIIAIGIVIVNIFTPLLKNKTVETTNITAPNQGKKKCCKSIRAKNNYNSRSLKRGR